MSIVLITLPWLPMVHCNFSFDRLCDCFWLNLLVRHESLSCRFLGWYWCFCATDQTFFTVGKVHITKNVFWTFWHFKQIKQTFWFSFFEKKSIYLWMIHNGHPSCTYRFFYEYSCPLRHKKTKPSLGTFLLQKREKKMNVFFLLYYNFSCSFCYSSKSLKLGRPHFFAQDIMLHKKSWFLVYLL